VKILKCDILYPFNYLDAKQLESKQEIASMHLEQYMTWLHSLRMGFYNLFSRELAYSGDIVFELFYQDNIQFNKIVKAYNLKFTFFTLFTPKGFKWWRDIAIADLKSAILNNASRVELIKRIQLRIFIDKFSPDIIFLREPCQIDNNFWLPYKGKIKIITMIGCNISHPINWRLHISDLIFTITKEFNDFFILNGIKSHLIEYGFDCNLIKELEIGFKKYDVTFVGLLGTTDQLKKTQFLEFISSQCDFKWWGPKGDLINEFPGLLRTWQGIVAGKEMYQVYANSRIVLNDYVHSNGDNAVNLRFKEVMGSGSFLLTRHASNLFDLENLNIFKTFSDKEDCIHKIRYYLTNDDEREVCAFNGQQYVFENHNYSQIIHEIREKFK
jgi:hypothetical protein